MKRKYWIPAFAGMTTTVFTRSSKFDHSLVIGGYYLVTFNDMTLVIFRQRFQLGITEDRAVFTNIEVSNVAPATFPDAAFHPLFE